MHTEKDLMEMVSSLMKVVGGIERARRQGDAATLSLLGILAWQGKSKPSALAARLEVHQSTITRQIRTLEDAGQVLTEADPEDGRSCLISLTEKGMEEVRRLTEVGLSRFSLMVEDWPKEDVQTLANLLTRLAESQSALVAKEQKPVATSWRRKS